ncbi:MAG: transposase family protein, partial [Rhodospirillaceae bacterium]|nr:transposase family protein [Rhodospirillaceae bacterium]
EMLMIALLCMICGSQTCTDMELFVRSKEVFLRRFMKLAHCIPSHDAFSSLFRVLDPECACSGRSSVLPLTGPDSSGRT